MEPEEYEDPHGELGPEGMYVPLGIASLLGVESAVGLDGVALDVGESRHARCLGEVD
jgi:hypothetical protein